MGIDFQHVMELMPDITKAFGETLYMISISLVIALVIGLPLGILLFTTDKGLFLENQGIELSYWFYRQYGPFCSVYYFACRVNSFNYFNSRYSDWSWRC